MWRGTIFSYWTSPCSILDNFSNKHCKKKTALAAMLSNCLIALCWLCLVFKIRLSAFHLRLPNFSPPPSLSRLPAFVFCQSDYLQLTLIAIKKSVPLFLFHFAFHFKQALTYKFAEKHPYYVLTIQSFSTFPFTEAHAPCWLSATYSKQIM